MSQATQAAKIAKRMEKVRKYGGALNIEMTRVKIESAVKISKKRSEKESKKGSPLGNKNRVKMWAARGVKIRIGMRDKSHYEN